MGKNRRGRKRPKNDGDRNTWAKKEWKPNESNYVLPERNNELFVKYYQGQNLVPDGEWESFLETIRKDLPVTFRITGSRSQAKALLKRIQSQFFSNIASQSGQDTQVEPPSVMPWYPDEMAWQINMSRKFIRSNATLQKLHEFLVSETESGNISRQESVSMIPPLLLDIQSHHKVLDLCAAPGSKTAQLIEFLHGDSKEVPEGFVMANDKDNKRCYLMVHQIKRLQSPNFLIVNEDASVFPKIRITPEDEKPVFIEFDRILADVPCTGDGTMRKNPDVWAKWKPTAGPNLHFLQLKILKRGLELLSEGGRLVYSTCSFNPVEDEAVIADMLRQCKGSVELLDVSQSLPGLKYVKGLSEWKVMSGEGEWFDSYENVPTKKYGQYRPTMFPPTEEEAKWMNLDRCMRILPHHQNTGGFFICALTKKTNLPWMKKKENPVTVKETTDGAAKDSEKSDQGDTTQDGSSEAEARPPPAKKQRKVYGYKEDPFFFATEDDPVWPSVKDFYKVPDDFPITQVMFRSATGGRKNMYFVSKQLKRVVVCNANRVKLINLGMKMVSRNPSPLVPECDFRLNQECVGMLYQYFPARYVSITREDTVVLLSQESPFFSKFDPATQEQMEKLSPGSAIFHFKPTESDSEPELIFCGWRGKLSVRSFVSGFERSHYMFLFGLDMQAYQAEAAKRKADDRARQKEKERLEKQDGGENDETDDVAETEAAEPGDEEVEGADGEMKGDGDGGDSEEKCGGNGEVTQDSSMQEDT